MGVARHNWGRASSGPPEQNSALALIQDPGSETKTPSHVQVPRILAKSINIIGNPGDSSPAFASFQYFGYGLYQSLVSSELNRDARRHAEEEYERGFGGVLPNEPNR